MVGTFSSGIEGFWKNWMIWWEHFLCRFGGKGWWMVLCGLAQGYMAQMMIVRGVTHGMSWLVFSNIGGYCGFALGTSISYVFQVSGWEVQDQH